MLRGLVIPRSMVSGVITSLLFTTRAIKKYVPHNSIIKLLNDPVVVFILFLIAGIIILYPWLRGIKAIILSILMVFFITFFVYTYYILGWCDKMVKKKPTIKRLKYLIKDEENATKEYKKYGYKGLSRDEARHKNFLQKKLKTVKKSKKR